MLYYLYEYLTSMGIHVPGLGLLKYISFRAGMAVLFSLTIALVYGKRIINYLRAKQMGELVRDLGLDGQKQKEGTPTMGGLIIILATLIPVLLFTRITNVYIVLLIVSVIWMGAIGFLDDYLKKIKKNKDGLSGKFKIVGQVGLGLIVGVTMYFHPDITVKRKYADAKVVNRNNVEQNFMPTEKITVSTVPFAKNNEFDYSGILFWMNDKDAHEWAWIVFIPIVIFIVTAVSNGANITDGIDGLAAGTSTVILLTLGLFAYLSGNIIFADYLNIMFLPNMGETTIFVVAMVGAVIGFFWYNTYPAQVFMGDTGSLMLGGVIAVLAIILRKELMIPVLCGIFLIENISVMLQVVVFKYRKRKFGLEYAQNNRLFRMSPLHHHYQKGGFHESKIVNRMIIIGVMLAIVCLITLKMR
ncbi:MAG: phospho-N-acetylmuramoyl-pentapeptide-transferase [Chlorobi bacterium]|jgi:phospho-N-acetylmuramoyl-pentapeptide-transferase|uniref:Phospho-N-acetylmuramoyl-pentapeptide-transferase n=4 Tax=Chryseobacterium TaxID=59732 RepID=A0A1N7MDA1_9FLAO|nr:MULTISPECIES: phospho-N-acetylmuramoyl-pentapeptide-transferase [Chryseobacterium]NPA07954.1 phospho-N-acetylmuramoyl-pentapeptide-transferase [Chlorobiota bacterium]HAO08525.1 phospho-N-acetylmuramoyl-pentapeptide-transferase [Chryseobacterium sp.]MBL7881257.1 phospho-N-acetylmuramoyl-pentapeptide-transferase [Chryseobacterium gambrini]MCF2220890.1 phospho-N-acetylmuramoyl-pentapeptide-transferase [Chryseobacterium sp. PS-8]MCQ4139909.1 phospho-N-acetylmuramoyl-pentapeptide-transferase [Ch